jgi:serine/threonine protein kinase
VDAAPSFGRYKVIATLGSGAMGHVYAAVDDVLGRAVAVKTLRSGSTGATARMLDERFRLEARAVAALNHPSIVQVYDLDLAANPPYLVMERMSGPSLSDEIKAGPLAAHALRALGIQIARALAAAHAAGIVHRDVKPANILAGGPGIWKLADFGVAHVPDSSLTMTGQFIGSPAYAPPEALVRGQSTEAGDVFGLGATLYCAAAGKWPRASATNTGLLAPIPSIRTLAPHLPDDLVATIDRAVELEPLRRPTAVQLAEALASASAPPMPAVIDQKSVDTAVLGPATRPTSTATEVLPSSSMNTPPVQTAFVPDATNQRPNHTAFVPDATSAPRPHPTAFVPDRSPVATSRPRWLPWIALALVSVAVIAVVAATRGGNGAAKAPVAQPTEPVARPNEPRANEPSTDQGDDDHAADPSLEPAEPGQPQPPGAPEPPASGRTGTFTLRVVRPRTTNPNAARAFEPIVDELYNGRYTYALERLVEWERQWGETAETRSLREQLEGRTR